MGEINQKFTFLLKIAVIQLTFIFLFFLNLAVKDNNSRTSDVNIQPVLAQDEERGIPTRIKIPRIQVDAVVQEVNVAENGEMESPSNSSDVAWFELGPRPGKTGSSVIAGHFDGKNGEDGVFKDLGILKEGDVVTVEDDKGMTSIFIVRQSKAYGPGENEEVFGQSDGKHLNLITCDGVWDEDKKSYSKRLVVFADIMN